MDLPSALALATMVVAAVVVLTLAAGFLGPLSGPSAHPHETTPEPRRRVAIVVNPTKLEDPLGTRATLEMTCVRLGWERPLWLETTPEDAGHGAALQAREEGVHLVCALGGDGTVRSVASALVHSPCTLAILPRGTGNLLARNLGLPVDSLVQALTVALTGTDTVLLDVGLLAARDDRGRYLTRGEVHAALTHPSAVPLAEPPTHTRSAPGHWTEIDASRTVTSTTAQPLGEATETPTPAPSRLRLDASPWRHADAFLVMAGVGFDAKVMAGAPEELKAQMGWGAYVVAGLQEMNGRRFTTSLRLDDNPPRRHRVQSVMIGNVGRMQGGVSLFPGASASDGVLDVMVLSPKGVLEWASVSLSLLTKQREWWDRVTHHQGTRVSLACASAQRVQVDGDIVGKASLLHIGMLPGSLRVRCA